MQHLDGVAVRPSYILDARFLTVNLSIDIMSKLLYHPVSVHDSLHDMTYTSSKDNQQFSDTYSFNHGIPNTEIYALSMVSFIVDYLYLPWKY
jgi:hypothetical protein